MDNLMLCWPLWPVYLKLDPFGWIYVKLFSLAVRDDCLRTFGKNLVYRKDCLEFMNFSRLGWFSSYMTSFSFPLKIIGASNDLNHRWWLGDSFKRNQFGSAWWIAISCLHLSTGLYILSQHPCTSVHGVQPSCSMFGSWLHPPFIGWPVMGG